MKPFHFTLESVYRLRQEAVDRANDVLAREMLELGENLTGHPGLPEQVTPNLAAN